MADAAQKVIGGRTYSFGTLPATDAVRVEVAVAKVIGEPLFKAFAVANQGLPAEKAKAEQEAAANGAIATMAAKMDPDDLIRTMQTVFRHVSCNGTPIDIDSTFTGRPKELWLVFVEALKVNFSDFFPAGLLTSIGAAPPSAP